MTPTSATGHLAAEAAAFDRRIEERLAAGFVPDLRRAVRCEYFYKSFWRDPHFIDLYLGRQVRSFLELIDRYAGPGARVLDAGCGAGYMTLELARHGHQVRGVDISAACIDAARTTLATNPYRDGFGSLAYDVASFDEVEGEFDVVLFSGCLHHFDDVDAALERAARLATPNGCVLFGEPCHERWTEADAAQVTLMRSMLAMTGFWYEPDRPDEPITERALESAISAVHAEYVDERDPHEGGQSPNDNACTGADILAAARRHLEELETRPTVAFMYRMLGGLRGPQATIERIATLLATYDRLAVRRGYMQPNGFLFAGRPIGDGVPSPRSGSVA
ncbi:MAG: methyltransferase domain-containing protein [Phycisphaerales bacterium]|nr:methyltransferase domain-containing protein [Phycisphaerae bacterium]NNF43482.1 methyltransferase domain-containing protein [Phycisphaerales bacterium]NNM26895.1 methyltransferase domain-containing protein [Phycisphaerales bacterium]